MAIVTMPGQLNDRADFYQQTATLIGAGFGLQQVFQKFALDPPVRSFSRLFAVVSEALTEGCTFSEALKRARAWIPELDAALLESGELSGRLEQSLRLLSDYYRDNASILRKMYGDLAYPVALVLAAIFLIPVVGHAPQLVKGELGPYLSVVGVGMVVFVAVTAGILWILRSPASRSARKILERLLSCVPLFGRARHHLFLARLAVSLEALIQAGINVIDAWGISARASGSVVAEEVVENWKWELQSGRTPSELIAEERYFPSTFASLYHTGEISGNLDDHLHRIYIYYQESGSFIMKQLAQWLPRLLYAIMAGIIGFVVIKFWAGYFGQFDSIMGQ